MIDDHQVFLDKAKEETKSSGMRNFSMDWREMAENLGLSEDFAEEIVTDLHQMGYISFTDNHNQDFMLTRLSWQ